LKEIILINYKNKENMLYN